MSYAKLFVALGLFTSLYAQTNKIAFEKLVFMPRESLNNKLFMTINLF